MSVLEIIVLALIQGLTEFLPVSSSGHLLFPSLLLGWKEQGLDFDIAVHFGSLLAVCVYMRKEVAGIFFAWCNSIAGKQSQESRLAWLILVSTLIFGFAGILVKDYVDSYLRETWVVATTTVFYALLLWGAIVYAKENQSLNDLGWKSILVIGISQILAVIPGTSRSGITITMGIFLGLNKTASAKFSFLLSIPVIASMGIYLSLDLATTGTAVDWQSLGLGVLFSFVAAFACISVFISLLNRIGMMPFIIYRLLLGAVLFALI